MKINEVKLLDIIPENMRDDRTIKGFSAAWDYVYGQINEKLKLVSLFDNLDLLTDAQLNEVADAMQVPWFETALPRESRESIISHYEQNCFELGTVSSLKRVIKDIFDDAVIIPWYETGADQYTFKIVISNMPEDLDVDVLLKYINAVKPADAILASIERAGKINTTIWINPFVTSYYKGVVQNIVQPQESSLEIKNDNAGHGIGIVSNKKMQIEAEV